MKRPTNSRLFPGGLVLPRILIPGFIGMMASISPSTVHAQSTSFGAQQVITGSANGAFSVYATDLDGDGDADVLSASRFVNTISWHENLGGGAFGASQVITMDAGNVTSVYATDLDGDGDADVLSASASDDQIEWYENLGGGSFGPQEIISNSARGASSVHAKDLDGDGDLDVLSASVLDDKIAWYENLGGGSFGAQQVITTSADDPESVYATDLDGDGDADVLSASYFDDKIAWYENLGGGSFSTSRVITTAADGAESVYATDLDGDGDADVLSASVNDDKIAWYENLGGGSFGPSQVITTDANFARSVYSTDLDGDGDADVLSASFFDDKVAWYENLGGGSFGVQQVITTASDGAGSVYATDLDGDGDADVLSASRDDNKIAWHENLYQPPPANDECADALPLVPGTPTAFDTSAATQGAPAWTCGNGGGPDIWFSYTTTNDDAVTVSTCDTAAYDTVVEVFAGDCANLSLLTCNDDGPGCAGFTSEATVFGLPVGTDLYIRIGGWGGSAGTGTVELTLAPPPACGVPDAFEDNDDCAGAAAISDGNYPGLTILDADNDYFAVTVADGATLDASILFTNVEGDMDLYLWDPLVACDTNVAGPGGGTGALALSFSASDDENLNYTNTSGAAQDLILEVDMFDAGGCNTYDLIVTGSGVDAGPIGTNYCTAVVNSTGAAGAMSAFGFTSVAANDVTLTASSLPNSQFGLFFTAATSDFIPGAGGQSNGNLCLAQPLDRLLDANGILGSGATGEFSATVDLTLFPDGGGTTAVMAGEKRYFQAWYRDQVGLGSNLTDGIWITFTN